MKNQFLEEVALEEKHEEEVDLSFQDGINVANEQYALEALFSDFNTFTQVLEKAKPEMGEVALEGLAMVLDTNTETIAAIAALEEDSKLTKVVEVVKKLITATLEWIKGSFQKLMSKVFDTQAKNVQVIIDSLGVAIDDKDLVTVYADDKEGLDAFNAKQAEAQLALNALGEIAGKTNDGFVLKSKSHGKIVFVNIETKDEVEVEVAKLNAVELDDVIFDNDIFKTEKITQLVADGEAQLAELEKELTGEAITKEALDGIKSSIAIIKLQLNQPQKVTPYVAIVAGGRRLVMNTKQKLDKLAEEK